MGNGLASCAENWGPFTTALKIEESGPVTSEKKMGNLDAVNTYSYPIYTFFNRLCTLDECVSLNVFSQSLQ